MKRKQPLPRLELEYILSQSFFSDVLLSCSSGIEVFITFVWLTYSLPNSKTFCRQQSCEMESGRATGVFKATSFSFCSKQSTSSWGNSHLAFFRLRLIDKNANSATLVSTDTAAACVCVCVCEYIVVFMF